MRARASLSRFTWVGSPEGLSETAIARLIDLVDLSPNATRAASAIVLDARMGSAQLGIVQSWADPGVNA